MSTVPSRAAIAIRWIDQRLREIVLHHDALVEAVLAAIDEHRAAGRIDDRGRREIVATIAANRRDATISEADSLLRIREKCVGGRSDIATLPASVFAALSKLRDEQRRYRDEQAEESAWFDEVFERCGPYSDAALDYANGEGPHPMLGGGRE